jgi:hypothetical protein
MLRFRLSHISIQSCQLGFQAFDARLCVQAASWRESCTVPAHHCQPHQLPFGLDGLLCYFNYSFQPGNYCKMSAECVYKTPIRSTLAFIWLPVIVAHADLATGKRVLLALVATWTCFGGVAPGKDHLASPA